MPLFFPGFVRDLYLTENLAGSLVTFMDIDVVRLALIHRLAERYVEELGGSLRLEQSTDLRMALQESDFVINTTRARAHAPRGEARPAAQARLLFRAQFPRLL